MAEYAVEEKAKVFKFGSVNTSISNEKSDDVKVVNKKKKKPEVTIPAIADTTLWPDIAQAAVVVRAAEEKKEKAKEKKDEEGSSIAEESSATSSKFSILIKVV